MTDQPPNPPAFPVVNHHGGETLDHYLIRDEINKAAYRDGKSFEFTASRHVAGLRYRIAKLEEKARREA